MFYGSFAMLTLGGFILRYRLELVLAYPFIAIVMAVYLNLSFKANSPTQSPEHLFREPALMSSVLCCAAVMALLLFIDIPQLGQLFTTENSPLPAAR
jgi:decaprenyl-phosphate phosphoribosyltransferase